MFPIKDALRGFRASATDALSTIRAGVIAVLKPAKLSILHADPADEMVQATVYTDGAAGYTDYPELAPVS